MLEPCMELEADLGIDSIKRVEILSAVRRAIPDLPEVDPIELGKLRTLGEIIQRLHTTETTTTQAPAPAATPAPAAAQPAPTPTVEPMPVVATPTPAAAP